MLNQENFYNSIWFAPMPKSLPHRMFHNESWSMISWGARAVRNWNSGWMKKWFSSSSVAFNWINWLLLRFFFSFMTRESFQLARTSVSHFAPMSCGIMCSMKMCRLLISLSLNTWSEGKASCEQWRRQETAHWGGWKTISHLAPRTVSLFKQARWISKGVLSGRCHCTSVFECYSSKSGNHIHILWETF